MVSNKEKHKVPQGADNGNLTNVSVSAVREGFLEEGTFKRRHSLLAFPQGPTQRMNECSM